MEGEQWMMWVQIESLVQEVSDCKHKNDYINTASGQKKPKYSKGWKHFFIKSLIRWPGRIWIYCFVSQEQE